MSQTFQLRVLLLLFLLVGITNMISWRSQVLAHELTHQAIFTAFGVESKIVLHDFGFRGETVPLSDYKSEEDRRMGNLLQAQNELISYQFFPVYVSNLVLQLILIFAIYKLGHKLDEAT